ncbi:hypothetical protein Sjap_003665 [Stephania japonica]|uniref:Uncharacterized protein n=1 Tax=Stephania japonica TaxID=461633 RepID=A0AAP0KQ64_9MAGN
MSMEFNSAIHAMIWRACARWGFRPPLLSLSLKEFGLHATLMAGEDLKVGS